MGHFRKEGAHLGGRPPGRAKRGGWAASPRLTRPMGGWTAAPPPPPPCLVPHGGAKEEGSPLPPIYMGATWRKLIKEKSRSIPENWEKFQLSPRHLLPPLHPSRTPWSLEGPCTRGKSSPLDTVVLSEFRQKIYFRHPGGIGGFGSRRLTPYVCEYLEVLLQHSSSSSCQVRHDFEVGFRSSTPTYYTLSLYKRYVTGTIPLPHY